MKEGKVLLLQRANTWYHDWEYSVIAWHVEHNETFTDAVIREAKEEAWIDIMPIDAEVAHIQHRKSDKDGGWRVHTYFVAKTWKWEIMNMEPKKCSDLSRFSTNKLPKNMVECVKHAIKCIQKGEVYSEFGKSRLLFWCTNFYW